MRPAAQGGAGAGKEPGAATNGAHPANEVETLPLGVRTGCAEARRMVCVLLLPGRALKDAAGARAPASLEAPGTGPVRVGDMPAELERTVITLGQNPGRVDVDGVSDDRRVLYPTRPKAHLTSGISGERSESAACRG